MAGGIADFNAEFGRPSIDEESAGLKDRALASIEIREVDEIVQDAAEITAIEQGPLHVVQTVEFWSEGGIVADHLVESLMRTTFADLFDFLHVPAGHLALRFPTSPGRIGLQAL